MARPMRGQRARPAGARDRAAGLCGGRRSLRVALTELRKALGDAALLGDRDALALNPAAAAEIDAQRFIHLLGKPHAASTADLLAGLALYRGDLLEAFYDEWVLPLTSSSGRPGWRRCSC
ncbi:MAG: hypothetical protein FJ011_23175 [Chloroflexi bacterium]|nr:hypothetical protein [Chloroflexota bacterium]